MTRSLQITTILGLLCFAGCDRTPNRRVFEGTLFTYAAEREPEDGTVWTGTVPLTHPRIIFRSDEFWHTYADLNTTQSDAQIRSIRSNFKIRLVEKFRFKERWVTQWLLQLENGDQSVFDSLCKALEKEHLRLRSERSSGREFLLERRDALEHGYVAAAKAYTEAPSPGSERRLKIARNNFHQIGERIEREISTEQHGQIVPELMGSEKDSGASKD